MKPTLYMNPEAEADVRKLRQAITETRGLLSDAAEKLRAVLGDETILVETPVEVEAAIDSAVEATEAALRRLDSAVPAKKSSAAPPPGGPTRQQGQFLAFIREYMMRNQAGVAPKVCRAWQQAVRDDFRDRFSPEHPVGPGMNEKIDLVDLQGRVAYKLKVSKNNTHFEFYRDIFKVAVHNPLHPDLPLTKLVFITPEAGALRLNSPYGCTVVHLATQFGIKVAIVGI
jgi:hypothetical protein